MNIRITDIDGLKPVLTQWDVDRVLYVEGCATKPMLHVWNDTLTRAIVVEPEADGSRWACRVPNILLQHFMPIVVSVFIQPDEEDEGKTVARFVLQVRPKAKPQDYTYEENIGYVNWVEKSEEAQELLDNIDDLRQEIQSAATTATSASEAAVAAAEDIDETVAAALQAAKASGDFDGADGRDGQDGEDGVSPTISSESITGGHRLTITDADGVTTVDVMDGEDGEDGEDGAPGEGVPTGGSTGQVLKKASGTDYDTVWANESGGGGGLSSAVKAALIQIAQKVAYIDDQGQTYYQDLYDALYPSASLVSISAAYTQSSTVYPSTQLDSLKTDLVVTGTYDDSSTATIPATDYTLSGTLTVGTSTVTATSGGKTTTFTVTVTAQPTLSAISAVYTQSGTVYDTDTLDSLKTDLVVTATYSDSSTAIVPAADYTLSGTLTEGTSTITVSYGGKTTTFSVTVTQHAVQVNYVEVGTPTIENGILTVTDGNFVKTPEAFSPGANPWKIRVKYKHNSVPGSNAYQDIFGGVDASNASVRTLLVESSNYGSRPVAFLSSNNSSWDISSTFGAGASGISYYTVTNWLWLELSYDGSKYHFQYSFDGETFTGWELSSTAHVYGGFAVAYGLKRNGILDGQIDLSECKIWIDGQLWWEAIG